MVCGYVVPYAFSRYLLSLCVMLLLWFNFIVMKRLPNFTTVAISPDFPVRRVFNTRTLSPTTMISPLLSANDSLLLSLCFVRAVILLATFALLRFSISGARDDVCVPQSSVSVFCRCSTTCVRWSMLSRWILAMMSFTVRSLLDPSCSKICFMLVKRSRIETTRVWISQCICCYYKDRVRT